MRKGEGEIGSPREAVEAAEAKETPKA